MPGIDQVNINGTNYEIVPEIAPLFDASTSYAAGDMVIKDAALYKFTTAHTAGAWIGTDAVSVTVGSEISNLKSDLSEIEEDVMAIVPGLTEEAKTALLECFTHVAWVNSNGQTYFNALKTALGRSILYSWDFTKSLIDEIQGITASLVGLTNPPTQGNTGIIFNDIGQAITLLSDDFTYADFLKGKTVQIDVAEFDPQSTVTARTLRFLTMKDPTASGSEALFKTGLCYFEDNTPDPRWCLVTYQEGASVSYVPDEVSFMSAKEDISGHTIGVYFDASGRIKVYRDGILKGTSNNAISDAGQCGLQLGYAGEARYGGRFYNARVTGVRIYDGDIA